jgi:hypothetical protein
LSQRIICFTVGGVGWEVVGVDRSQIERAEKMAERLTAGAHKVEGGPRVDVDAVRSSEVYRRRFENMRAACEASGWVRPESLSGGRVGRVEPVFEEWQLALALESLERRGR